MKTCFLIGVLFLSAALFGQDSSPGKQIGRTRKVTIKPGAVTELCCPLSTPEESFTMAVEFPGEKAISNIVQAFSKDDVSLEAKSNRLFVKLLARVKGHVDVIGAGQALYRLYIRPVEKGEEADAFVTIVRAINPEQASVEPAFPKPLKLATAMRLLQVPEGAQVCKGAGEPVIYRDGPVEYRLLYTYEYEGLVGWILKLSNTSEDQTFDVDLSRFSADRLVVLGARDLVLEPKSVTLLYLVFDSEK